DVPALDVRRTEKLLHNPVLEAEERPDLFLRVRTSRKCASDGRDRRRPLGHRHCALNWMNLEVVKPERTLISNHVVSFPVDGPGSEPRSKNRLRRRRRARQARAQMGPPGDV